MVKWSCKRAFIVSWQKVKSNPFCSNINKIRIILIKNDLLVSSHFCVMTAFSSFITSIWAHILSNVLQALVRELQNDVHLIRRQIRELKKMQKNRNACKTSTHKAQTLAASILNISRSDLEEILDTEDEAVRSLKYLLI